MAPRVWFITGCSSGFGQEMTLEALKRGDKVIATARNPAKIQGLKDAGADILGFDVTANLDSIKRTVEEAHGIHGRIDIVVNNAAYVREGAMEELRYCTYTYSKLKLLTEEILTTTTAQKKPTKASRRTSLAR